MSNLTEVTRTIGRTADGDRVSVTYATRIQSGEHQTVTHDTVTDPVEVSLTGEETGYRRREPHSGGQIRESLARVTEPAPGWSLTEVREIARLWERWHLNTIRAACAHMVSAEMVTEDNGYGGSRVSTTDPGNVCPVSGYRFGHAWLTEPVPAEVLERLAHLMRDRGHDVVIHTRYASHPGSNSGDIRATARGVRAVVRIDQSLSSEANHRRAAEKLVGKLGAQLHPDSRATDGGYRFTAR